MKWVAPSHRWTRAIAIAGLLLTLHAASPARSEVPAPAATGGQTLPLPPPGTHRLIRIGPQALVMQDDRGRLTMVDESTVPPPKHGQSLVATTTLFSILGVGAFLMLQGQNGFTLDVGGQVPARLPMPGPTP